MLPLLEPALAFNQTPAGRSVAGAVRPARPWGVADKYRGFARLDPSSERATAVRRAGGLAQRRHSARRAGGARVPGGLVRRQHPGTRRMADCRPAGRSRRAAPADLRGRAGPRPDRAAGIRPAARRADPAAPCCTNRPPGISAWRQDTPPSACCGSRLGTGCARCDPQGERSPCSLSRYSCVIPSSVIPVLRHPLLRHPRESSGGPSRMGPAFTEITKAARAALTPARGRAVL